MGRLGLEYAGIGACGADIAAIGVTAIRHAHEFAKNGPECASDYIARLVRRKIERARRTKLEAKSVEFERQRASITPFLPSKRAPISM
jgi:hypothetical protein